MSLPFVTATDAGCAIAVIVQPRASRSAVIGPHGDALKVSVTAPPVDGRANAAVEELLASLMGIPKRSATVVSGATGRSKRVELVGVSPADVVAALDAVLSSRTHEPRAEETRSQAHAGEALPKLEVDG